jgi:hypothetical protein
MSDPLRTDEEGNQRQQNLEEQKIALERYKAKLDYRKFIGASVFAAIAIAAIPPLFQLATNKLEADRKDRELLQSRASFHDNYVKEFLEKALNQDIELRIRLATYFSNVSDQSYKAGWDGYLGQIREMRDRLRSEINDSEQKLIEFQQNEPDKVAKIAELKRNMRWKYGELGYSEPNRDVVPDPRSVLPVRPAISDSTVIVSTGNIGKAVDCLASAGVRYVGRYYGHRTGRTAMTRDEVVALTKNGIRPIAIWSGETRESANFSAASGKDAANEAFDSARHVGQPGGSPIFFAVSYDAPTKDIEAAIKPFFESIKQVNSSISDAAERFRIGVAGSGAVIQSLRDAGLVELGWITIPGERSLELLSNRTWDLALLDEVTSGWCDLGPFFVARINDSRLKGSDVGFSIATRQGG